MPNENSERCPYCFNKFSDLKYTEDPILTKNGSSFIYDEDTGLLIPRPSATPAFYEGSTIVKNQHIIELQELNDDNKPTGGWTPVEGEAGSFWIPNKIHIKELRDAIEKGLGITGSTTPAERTEIMEQYLNYDEDGIERQNPHQLDWNDPTLTGTVWMGNISHMHIEDLRKALSPIRFEQFWWGNGTLQDFDSDAEENVDIPSRESKPLHIHKWNIRTIITQSGSYSDEHYGYTYDTVGIVIRTGNQINFNSSSSRTDYNNDVYPLGCASSATAWAECRTGIVGVDGKERKMTSTSKIRLVYSDATKSGDMCTGGFQFTFLNSNDGLLYTIRYFIFNSGYPYTDVIIIPASGDIVRNIQTDLISLYPTKNWDLAYLQNILITMSASSSDYSEPIPNAFTSASASITLTVDNILFSPSGNIYIPSGE